MADALSGKRITPGATRSSEPRDLFFVPVFLAYYKTGFFVLADMRLTFDKNFPIMLLTTENVAPQQGWAEPRTHEK